MIRLLFFIFVTLLIVSAPYWLYVPVILVGIILFPFYIEAMFFGFLIDTLYGSSHGFLWGFYFALIATLLVYFAVPLRKRFRFNV